LNSNGSLTKAANGTNSVFCVAPMNQRFYGWSMLIGFSRCLSSKLWTCSHRFDRSKGDNRIKYDQRKSDHQWQHE
jgi:hypothetical protein